MNLNNKHVEKRLILDLSLEELSQILHSWGEPSYRAKQIWIGLYKNYWKNASEFTNLPKSLRDRLSDNFRFRSLNPGDHLESKDKFTRKTLFHLDNHNAIEVVLMRYKKRRTLCISTQVGCAMGCTFCATGQMGFKKNLSNGQITEQVIYYADQLNQTDERLTNIVIMGMGEPFLNFDETIKSLDNLSHPDGFNMGSRKFTISTVGILPGIKRFMNLKKQYNLAISLHSIQNNTRSTLLPINKKYPVNVLLEACKEYAKVSHRRITFEWALIQGINDSIEQARELARQLQMFKFDGSMLCHVNIILLNPTKGSDKSPSTINKANSFKQELEKFGIPCTFRLDRGSDIQAGCGQLVTKKITR
jgi:23S rRNA (adenine2503-C2)-methyltransferase